ncbi:MAG: class II aldolase/adducin family protein [Planctomyces sp.]|nr:class II aldolase/adducin family protein [Planctomyces sp.]
MSDMLHPRDEIIQTMERIYRSRMTTTSGGNLSIRDDDGAIWISPARVDKGSLTRQDIVAVRQDGSVDGRHKPSSEFPFHKAIYGARPDLRGIVHAHPVALVAFSICRAIPDTRLFHQAYSVCGNLGFADYALPGSEQLGRNIAKTFADGADCVILENHGVVVGGDHLQHAFQRFEAFEFAAKTLIKAHLLGSVCSLNDAQLSVAQQRKVTFQIVSHDHPSTNEKELRRQLCAFVRRGCRQRLLISTEGSFSARVSGDSFLITPSMQDRELLDVDDFILIDGEMAFAAHGLPSRASRAHQEIYRRHPDVQAIVFAHPVNATAFSVTHRPLDARTIPESYLFLRDVVRIPFGVPYTDASALADAVSMTSPAALLENDGVMVLGNSVLDAFDRLEVFETTAEAVINAGVVGKVNPMNDAVIAELRSAFSM